MKEETWKEEEHPIWGNGGAENKVLNKLGLTYFPTKIWRKGKYSIIPPCKITFDLWELYDGEDTRRFDTLEEAQDAIL